MRFLQSLGFSLVQLGISLLPAVSQHASPGEQGQETARHYNLDLSAPLETRISPPPASLLKLFEEDGKPLPTLHTLTEEERRRFATAFNSLPPLHRRILQQHLRSVSFLDGMPNTALTSTVNPNEPFHLYDITIRAAILRQTASQWLTEKEQSCFRSEGTPVYVAVDAGKRDAILFVLLHEATHIVDSVLSISPPLQENGDPVVGAPPGIFTEDVWINRLTVTPRYHDALRERNRFRPGGEVLSMEQADHIYTSLRRTPFVSLYGSSNWYDDLAEYVAAYHWTQVLRQPYRFVIYREGKKRVQYEPMQSPLVRSRFDRMARFYTSEPLSDPRSALQPHRNPKG